MKKFILLPLAITVFTINSFATHNMGGDITYIHVPSATTDFTPLRVSVTSTPILIVFSCLSNVLFFE